MQVALYTVVFRPLVQSQVTPTLELGFLVQCHRSQAIPGALFLLISALPAPYGRQITVYGNCHRSLGPMN